METVEEIKKLDLLAAMNLISDPSYKKEPEDPEQAINAEIKKQLGVRPKDIPIQTNNSITADVSAWLQKIEPLIKNSDDSELKNHASWLFDLVISLINERAQIDHEIIKWRTFADNIMAEWMRKTMGLKGEQLGRGTR